MGFNNVPAPLPTCAHESHQARVLVELSCKRTTCRPSDSTECKCWQQDFNGTGRMLPLTSRELHADIEAVQTLMTGADHPWSTERSQASQSWRSQSMVAACGQSSALQTPPQSPSDCSLQYSLSVRLETGVYTCRDMLAAHVPFDRDRSPCWYSGVSSDISAATVP